MTPDWCRTIVFSCASIFASQDKIKMASDYWAGSIKDGGWVWVESVRNVASRCSLKDSAVLQKVREAATAFDLSTRCISADHDIPRALRCRGKFRMSCAKGFLCVECKDRLRQRRFRQEEERAKVHLWKKEYFLASYVMIERIANQRKAIRNER